MMTYGKRVVVVDDEEPIGHLLAEYLERHYFATVAVADGRQALRELHHRHFDAAITDLHMPYLDGLDLLCQCHLVWPQLPVILMSGNLLEIIWPAESKMLQSGNRLLAVGTTSQARAEMLGGAPRMLPHLREQCLHVWNTEGVKNMYAYFEDFVEAYPPEERTFCREDSAAGSLSSGSQGDAKKISGGP